MVYDDDASKWGQTLLGVRIAPTDEARERAPARAVIAIGSGAVRARLAAAFPGTAWVAVVHPRAWVHESVARERAPWSLPTLGAGAAVTKSILEPGTWAGVPARRLQPTER